MSRYYDSHPTGIFVIKRAKCYVDSDGRLANHRVFARRFMHAIDAWEWIVAHGRTWNRETYRVVRLRPRVCRCGGRR